MTADGTAADVLRARRLVEPLRSGIDVAAQERRGRALLDRKAQGERDPTQRFLHEYDALMRVAGEYLARHGAVFGEHPHKALRALVALTVGEGDVEAIVTARHAAKKSGHPPPREIAAALRSLREALQSELLGER